MGVADGVGACATVPTAAPVTGMPVVAATLEAKFASDRVESLDVEATVTAETAVATLGTAQPPKSTVKSTLNEMVYWAPVLTARRRPPQQRAVAVICFTMATGLERVAGPTASRRDEEHDGKADATSDCTVARIADCWVATSCASSAETSVPAGMVTGAALNPVVRLT